MRELTTNNHTRHPGRPCVPPVLSCWRPALHIALAAWLLVCAFGCTRSFYRKRADNEVSEILAAKDKYPTWAIMNFHVYPDPRVHSSPADYAAQLALSRKVCALMEETARSFNAVLSLHQEFNIRKKSLAANPAKELTDALADLEKRFHALEDGEADAPGFGILNRDLGHSLVMVQSADIKPGESAYRAVAGACSANAANIAAWNKLNSDTLPALNKLLAAAPVSALPIAPPATALACNP